MRTLIVERTLALQGEDVAFVVARPDTTGDAGTWCVVAHLKSGLRVELSRGLTDQQALTLAVQLGHFLRVKSAADSDITITLHGHVAELLLPTTSMTQ